MLISQLKFEELDRQTIHKVIFENLDDDGLSGDIIFVFGSINAPKYRVPRAVELYKSNRADKILMSGGQSKFPEATVMKDTALNLGVKESDILIEAISQNTKENVLYSKELIDRHFGLKNIKRLVLVTNYFHMRRCLLSMKTFMPEWIEYSLCGVPDINTRPDNWWTNERGRIRVMNEMERLIKYTNSKAICDSIINN